MVNSLAKQINDHLIVFFRFPFVFSFFTLIFCLHTKLAGHFGVLAVHFLSYFFFFLPVLFCPDGVRRLRREVVLLTDDRNLRVKALARDVPVRDLPTFMTWTSSASSANAK